MPKTKITEEPSAAGVAIAALCALGVCGLFWVLVLKIALALI